MGTRFSRYVELCRAKRRCWRCCREAEGGFETRPYEGLAR